MIIEDKTTDILTFWLAAYIVVIFLARYGRTIMRWVLTKLYDLFIRNEDHIAPV